MSVASQLKPAKHVSRYSLQAVAVEVLPKQRSAASPEIVRGGCYDGSMSSRRVQLSVVIADLRHALTVAETLREAEPEQARDIVESALKLALGKVSLKK